MNPASLRRLEAASSAPLLAFLSRLLTPKWRRGPGSLSARGADLREDRSSAHFREGKQPGSARRDDVPTSPHDSGNDHSTGAAQWLGNTCPAT
ncbi:hypothetical protein Srufu_025480 [Streptomyces libani subsp. rufus]|nr:hypothetical protein Srufu_025480 [Streptomyces libani subsp. rufus]